MKTFCWFLAVLVILVPYKSYGRLSRSAHASYLPFLSFINETDSGIAALHSGPLKHAPSDRSLPPAAKMIRYRASIMVSAVDYAVSFEFQRRSSGAPNQVLVGPPREIVVPPV